MVVISEERKPGVERRRPLVRLVCRPLAAGMLAVCVLLTVLAAAAAYPAAREAETLWLLFLLAALALGAAVGAVLLLLRFVARRYLIPLSQAAEAAALAASGDMTGSVGAVQATSPEAAALLDAVKDLEVRSTDCLTELEKALKRLAGGDLTTGMDCKRAAECGGVCAALDGTAEKLRGAVGTVRTALEQLAGPLDALAEDVGALEEGAAGQRQAQDGLRRSLERLAGQTRRRAQGAEEVSGAAEALRDRLTDCGRRQEELSQAVDRIGECAAEAGKIVKAMEAASFQCSVLARTAYVEAAGAGINGKGFAIVASELRMLASRSAQSAQDAAAFMAEMERTVRESAALASASSREVNGLSAAGDAVCRRAAGAARDAGQAEELKESVRQAACLEEAMEAELARTGRAAQTARQIKARVGKLRDALGVFRLR